MKRGILLASGGIDSTVMMYWLKKQDALESVIFMDYSQASADAQFEMVRIHADALDLVARREAVYWPKHARGKGFIFEAGKYPEPMTDPYAPLDYSAKDSAKYLEEQWDFLQGRNIVFLAYAGAWALARGVDTVYTAFQFDQPEWDKMDEQQHYGGVDTSEWFVGSFNQMAASGGGFSKPLKVVCPFLEMRRTKIDIVRLGYSLGVPFSKTHSCEFFPACGGCHQCLIRKDVLARGARFR